MHRNASGSGGGGSGNSSRDVGDVHLPGGGVLHPARRPAIVLEAATRRHESVDGIVSIADQRRGGDLIPPQPRHGRRV